MLGTDPLPLLQQTQVRAASLSPTCATRPRTEPCAICLPSLGFRCQFFVERPRHPPAWCRPRVPTRAQGCQPSPISPQMCPWRPLAEEDASSQTFLNREGEDDPPGSWQSDPLPHPLQLESPWGRMRKLGPAGTGMPRLLLSGPWPLAGAPRPDTHCLAPSRFPAFAIMIALALVRIGRGQGAGRPPLADFSGVRNLFGVCVYSFMCQHSLPSLVTPVSSKRRLTRLVLLDYVLILAFYGLLSFTAIFCFRGDSLLDMYTLNFARCDVVGVAAVRFFLGLFPVFTISTNFPIIAVTLRNNWKTLFHREGGTYPWVVARVVFPAITLMPPVLVAFCTHDLESLVGITGAYAGTGIQYVVPAFLVYHCRKDTQLAFGHGTLNKHRSPFRHTFWVGFVLLWAFSCFVFVTANIVLNETKL